MEALARRIAAALSGMKGAAYELLFVDDSDDDTPDRLGRLCAGHAHIRYVHREDGRGLSTAIVEGFALARGDWFIVMDADMQHPPESLPALIDAALQGGADIIIPSRFIPGGSDGGLSPWRKLVSWSARWIARLALRRVLPVHDPTSGYFAVRRKTAFSRPLDPIGWKILLELLGRAEYDRVREIPYSFEARDLGSSKFGLREQWQYLRHIGRLVRSSESDLRFWKFSAVGASGVAVNFAVYIPLAELGVQVSRAFATATAAAMLSNFILNNRFTWTHMKSDRLWYRIFKFMLVSLSGLVLSSLSVALLHSWLGAHYLAAGFAGILVSTGWNFALHNLWTFRRTAAGKLGGYAASRTRAARGTGKDIP